MNYELAYKIGLHPWEDAATDPPFATKFAEILDREEDGRLPPHGTPLDLGTDSAIWGIELAKRGWQVTGVDIVEKALRRARERIDQAGASRCGSSRQTSPRYGTPASARASGCFSTPEPSTA